MLAGLYRCLNGGLLGVLWHFWPCTHAAGPLLVTHDVTGCAESQPADHAEDSEQSQQQEQLHEARAAAAAAQQAAAHAKVMLLHPCRDAVWLSRFLSRCVDMHSQHHVSPWR